ncbi:MAG TPA: ubiquinone/menaquinone biosynthesis methyltransferase [Fimbriimonas sp.]|nr:ubiquinone/menaquinone biosynthesis methyltransferase [Fimbriimonas sp.]
MVEAERQTPSWDLEGDAKRSAVRSIFAQIANDYDRANAIMSFAQHQVWRRKAARLLNLKPGDSVLDLCSGTGDFLAPLRKLVGPKGKLYALDLTPEMLSKASSKDSEAQLLVGDACVLPFHDQTFEGVSVGWGIRNVPDIDQAHREAFRVLKSGGMFVSIDCAQPRLAVIRPVSAFFRKSLLGQLDRSLGHDGAYSYLDESTKLFRSREGLKESMSDAGFVDVRFFDLCLGNICIHVGRRP